MSFTKLVLVALLASSVVGCKKKEPEAPAGQGARAARSPIISPVNFDSGSTTIAENQEGAIAEAAEIMKRSDWKVLVVGLADATGDAAMNKQLSEARAEAVAAELRTRVPDVAADRITVHAIGERLATGETQSSRKVEFVFYKDEGMTNREIIVRSRVLEEDFRAKREAEQE